ncbi:MAG: hypothetical protein GX607_22635, partial [Myxococcales bacterium]|nr:hypothetical protein [Myxococcales bacterium]
PSGEPLRAEAHVTRHGALDSPSARERLRVVLRTRRGATHGARVIEADTCQGVAEAAAVVLALALVSPGAAPAAAPLPEDPTHPAGPDPAEPRRDPPRPAPPGPRSSSPRDPTLAVGAQGAVDGGALPRWALGGSLLVAWVPGRARVEVDVRRWLPQSRNVGTSAVGARFTLTSWGARACHRLGPLGDLELAPCVGVDGHWLAAHGYGADANQDASARWASLAAGALGRAPLTSWLALRTRVEATVPLARPRFVVERMGAVHQPAALGMSATFGAEVLFF